VLRHVRDLLGLVTPVLVLTARDRIEDKQAGFQTGADDYLTKPFNPRELLARMKGILRRTRSLPPARAESHRLRFAGWTLDLAARHLIAADGVVVPLSGTEFRLLQIFVTHPNRVLDRNQLMDLALGREATPFDRAIDVQVSRLRQRLGDDAREPRIIKTVRNGGYVLAVQVEKAA
jgi:two-component system OmpR family response regulator